MASPVAIVLLALGGLLVGGFWLSLRAERRRTRADVRRLAEHVLGAGQVQEAADRVMFEFRLSGHPARLTVAESSGRSALPSTLLWVGCRPEASSKLRLFESIPGGPAFEDRRIGDPDFDRAWIVQGGLAPKVFARESRADSVAHLQALRRFDSPNLEVGQDGLRIRVRESVTHEGEVRVLLRAAEAVLSALVGPAQPEVLWVELRQDAPALCQICGAGMSGRIVHCARCRTPHHRECWSYAGRCSTYGCGEKRFLRA